MAIMTNEEEILLLKSRIKDLEEENENHQKLQQEIIDNIPSFVFWKDRNSVYLGGNKRFKEAAGLKQGESIVGKTDFDLAWKKEESEFFVETDRRVMEADNAEYNIIEPQLQNDGSETWLETTKIPIKDSSNNVIGILGIFQDVTKSKNSEDEIDALITTLKEQNHKLQVTMNDLIRTQSQLIHSEKMATLGQLIAGIAHEINTPLASIKASIEIMSDSFQSAFALMPKIQASFDIESRQSFYKIVSKAMNSAPMYLSTREERQIKKEINSQLTDLNLKYDEVLVNNLLEINASSDLTELVPIIQKENGKEMIGAMSDLCRQKNLAEVVLSAVDRSSRIVKALKTYVHKDSFDEMGIMNVVESIDNVLLLYSNQIKKDIEIIKNYPPKEVCIECSSDEINQIWVNLINNAVDAMANGGRLTIDVIELDKEVRIEIKDTGKGISESIKNRVFQPYFTTKSKGSGTGIGLGIVNKIVERHHGKIYFESAENKGTSFIVVLPKNQEVK